MLASIRELYEGQSERANRFRQGLLIFDLATLVFIVVTSFTPRGTIVETLDILLGLVILAEFIVRMAASRERAREALRLSTWTDVIAIASFLAPLTSEGAGFLRVLRTLRILRLYTTMNQARGRDGPLNRNEEMVLAAAHLGVFIFVMTAIVYETQHRTNPDIAHYADALYFTVTALTTTGFGDITLPAPPDA